jgi:regulatory protein
VLGHKKPRPDPGQPQRPLRSLEGRALAHLARREHSRLELQRKLAPYAEDPGQVEFVLDQLAQAGLLSEQRFVESLVRRRAERFGVRRIAHEIERHRLHETDTAAWLTELADTEHERALAVWRKRFGTQPVDLAERARQHRFLAQRGFGGGTIAWVMQRAGASDADSDVDPNS